MRDGHARLPARRAGYLGVGVDPAAASLAVARRKPGAERVRWVHGDAGAAAGLEVELVTMTGNVAQVFVDDDEWHATLAAIRAALRPGGRLVFETRDPARRAWEQWTRAATWQRVHVPGVGEVESWNDLNEVALPLVSFRTSFVFHADVAVLTSDSTGLHQDTTRPARGPRSVTTPAHAYPSFCVHRWAFGRGVARPGNDCSVPH